MIFLCISGYFVPSYKCFFAGKIPPLPALFRGKFPFSKGRIYDIMVIVRPIYKCTFSEKVPTGPAFFSKNYQFSESRINYIFSYILVFFRPFTRVFLRENSKLTRPFCCENPSFSKGPIYDIFEFLFCRFTSLPFAGKTQTWPALFSGKIPRFSRVEFKNYEEYWWENFPAQKGRSKEISKILKLE